jgi:polyferredoxin
MEHAMDLRDHRGRLTRLAIAGAIGAVVTFVVLRAIGPAQNTDPVATGSVGMLAIGIFVVTTAVVLGFVTALHRRFRR